MKSTVIIYMIPLFIFGCTQTRTYPICFFDTSMTGRQDAEKIWPDSQKKLESLLQQNVYPWNSGTTMIISSTIAAAKTTSWQHSNIGKYWSNIACFGDWTGSNIAKYQICQKYISTYLEYTSNGTSIPESTLIPQCQTLSPPSEAIKTHEGD